MKKYDICIVGAGPAGIFTAIELLRHGSDKKIVIVEKGQPVEKRKCPKTYGGPCRNCKPYCHITTGFSGAGAFSDGKLSLSYEVGGELPELIGHDFAQELIDYTDKIYLEFGADEHIFSSQSAPLLPVAMMVLSARISRAPALSSMMTPLQTLSSRMMLLHCAPKMSSTPPSRR